MEVFLALIKVINPIEWFKECYKMPICVKLSTIFICGMLLLLPEKVKFIDTTIMQTIALWVIPIITITLIGEIVQSKQNDKMKEIEIEKKKKEEEKAKEEELKRVQEQINEYFEAFDYCTLIEKEVLIKFYRNQGTSIYVNDVSVVRVMHKKGLTFLTCDGAFKDPGTAFTTIAGLRIINTYFDKQKPDFFNLLKTLEENELKLLKKFYDDNDAQVFLNKKEIKTAKSIISKFKKNNFEDIYIDYEGFFTISNLYSAYIDQFFCGA